MTPKTYNQLKAIIVKACPEIVGCGDPRCEKGHYPYQSSEDGDVDWGGCPVCVVDGAYNPPFRDITLEDVLRAINNKTERAVYLDIFGSFYDLTDGEFKVLYKKRLFDWDLGKPLSSQSEDLGKELLRILE